MKFSISISNRLHWQVNQSIAIENGSSVMRRIDPLSGPIVVSVRCGAVRCVSRSVRVLVFFFLVWVVRLVGQRVYLIYICMTLLPNEMSKANKAK